MKKLRKFRFFRHGNALAPQGGQEDMVRELSPKGVSQAEHRRDMLPTAATFRGPAINSVAVRASVTGAIINSLRPYAEENRMIGVPELFSSKESAIDDRVAELFEQLRYAPLSEYRNHDAETMDRFAEIAAAAVNQAVKRWEAEHGEAEEVFIYGHAVLLQATALALCPELDRTVLDELILGEAEGFSIEGNTIILHQD